MKKFITSIFLILSIVTTGLMSYTPSVSAINKSAVRCDFLGQYINQNVTGNPCQPCPENNYCPLVSGTQIENCLAKGYPATDCSETRIIFSTDKATPCPAGTSTRGFTFNTLRGTRITTEGDLFPVGQGATDISMCNAPEFTCTAPTPVLIKGVDGKAKCVPANTCAADQVPILKDGIPDCSVACKSNTIVGGKCYQDCAEGEYLEVIGTTVTCKKITITPQVCPIIGQIPATPGNLATCACVAPQTLNASVTPNKCETPIVPCTPPLTGNQPNCVLPPTTPCPSNTFGYSQPNCTPCPNNGTNVSPNNVDSASCKTPITPCEANTFGPSKPYCTPCPANSASPIGTLVASGCISTPTQNNGGGNFWNDFLTGALITGVLVGTDCWITHIICKSGGGDSNPVTSTTEQKQTQGIAAVRDNIQIEEIKVSGSSCVGSNNNLISNVYNNNPADAHPNNGNQYLWMATVAAGTRTEKMSTVRPAQGQTGSLNRAVDKDLLCLMQRFARKSGTVFSTSEYMSALNNAGCNSLDKYCGVLHGLNKLTKLECINLTKLGEYLGNFEESDSAPGSTKWVVKNNTQQFSYPETYKTKNEAIAAAKEKLSSTAKKIRVTKIQTEDLKLKTESGIDISNNIEATYETQPEGYFNSALKSFVKLSMPILASAIAGPDADEGTTSGQSTDQEDNSSQGEENTAISVLDLGELTVDEYGNFKFVYELEAESIVYADIDGTNETQGSLTKTVVNQCQYWESEDDCFVRMEIEKQNQIAPEDKGDPCDYYNYTGSIQCTKSTCNTSKWDCSDQPDDLSSVSANVNSFAFLDTRMQDRSRKIRRSMLCCKWHI
jgi:hypothetical protein